jgi:HAD superfamily hydrolase (TIGR01509 family)
MDDKRKLRAILWDMDGVIVDTYTGHLESWIQALAEVGQELTEETFKRTFGMNNRLILKTIYGRELDEDLVQRISDRKEELFRADIRGKVQALPGVLDWLNRFQKMGLKQAVASSAPQANIDALLDELGIRAYFQAEAAGATLRGKPDPAVFLLAAKMLNEDPDDCLVIEDSIAGVEAGVRSGGKVLAVLTTNPAEKLSAAHIIVKDLTFLTEEKLIELFA